ncbi:MAG: SDR family oxidoreductase [Gammaproteobacteria bacterium]
MTTFITGATGFIGRHLVQQLLKRDGDIHVLVRAGSEPKVAALARKVGDHDGRIKAVHGDLTLPLLGVSAADQARLKGKITHFFHLAAIYDLEAPEEAQVRTNIEGTRAAVQLAGALDAGCFHHVSSIAAAGLFRGTFREDMFEEAEHLDDPYLRTKHESEKLVRNECKVPWRVYRPAMVVGHSQTGEMDKIDGPYYFFKLIQKMRQSLPPWMPMIGIEGGKLNIVPVDYVAAAMDHIAHQPGLDGQCFHLTDREHHRVGELLNLFARAAHAPQFTMRIDTRMFGFVPPALKQGLSALGPVRRVRRQVLKDLGVPDTATSFVNYPTRFDNRDAVRALKGSGIECPPLDTYAWRLWDYWERHLDPDLYVDRSLAGAVKGRIVMVTGATSGIGHATALMLAEAGAHVLLVARTPEKLETTLDEIRKLGGKASAYRCDVSDMADCDRLVTEVLRDHGHVDILVNNAGRSIRRSIMHSLDRFHDFERTMQLNYFGALRLTIGLLPVMQQRRSGHIVNISSIGVLTNAPRFSAYVASKSALDSFTRCAAAEFSDEGIHFSTINMPLVKTPMIAPTRVYEHVPTISPEEAAELIAGAIIHRHKRVATRLGIFLQVAHFVAPKLSEIVMNTGFRMFPDSAAAQGRKDDQAEVSPEQVAFTALMKGIHW